MVQNLEVRTLSKPDRTELFPKRKIETIRLGGREVIRFVLDPGWRWSEHVGAATSTKFCLKEHTGYHFSGRLCVQMADGTKSYIDPDQVALIPAGHDAWVIGDESVVILDWTNWSNR